ncbi:MAG: alpha/beta hydrolase, partial [Gammaproteobacteria bacterium]|nr:alpha/beta hydrolase [Gammaproteobacteria bacterium]
GPLVVMIHGFPDYWYSWRHQMNALQDRFKVAAIDQRGYNRSGQPQGVDNYAMPLLVGDVAAVIAAEGAEKAIVVGHDWGGAVAWNIAMARPELVDLLVILNLPHPNGLARELMNNPAQQANSQYARDFQQPGAHKMLTAEGLAGWVSDEDARAHYVKAFERSDFEAMLNYYKANYPRADSGEAGLTPPSPPKVQMPVLMFHGLDDQALLPAALNGTWNWLERDLTLVTVPGAGHFVQQDAADLVSASLRSWLLQRRG